MGTCYLNGCITLHIMHACCIIWKTFLCNIAAYLSPSFSHFLFCLGLVMLVLIINLDLYGVGVGVGVGHVFPVFVFVAVLTLVLAPVAVVGKGQISK